MATNRAADPSRLVDQLRDKSSVKRRTAARQLGMLLDPPAGKPLYEAFLREREDSRTCETQGSMARALGLLRYQPAAEELLKIINRSPDHDLISRFSSTAYCRISRSSLSDVGPVLQVVAMNRFSTSMGALEAVGCDRMIPSQEDIHSVLEYAKPWRHQKGFGDPRYGAAVAAAGWSGLEVEEFLQRVSSKW